MVEPPLCNLGASEPSRASQQQQQHSRQKIIWILSAARLFVRLTPILESKTWIDSLFKTTTAAFVAFSSNSKHRLSNHPSCLPRPLYLLFSKEGSALASTERSPFSETPILRESTAASGGALPRLFIHDTTYPGCRLPASFTSSLALYHIPFGFKVQQVSRILLSPSALAYTLRFPRFLQFQAAPTSHFNHSSARVIHIIPSTAC